MIEKIARYYVADKNPEGGMLPGGVPLADITLEQWESYPSWLRRSIDAAPFYRRGAHSPPLEPEPEPPPPVGAVADTVPEEVADASR